MYFVRKHDKNPIRKYKNLPYIHSEEMQNNGCSDILYGDMFEMFLFFLLNKIKPGLLQPDFPFKGPLKSKCMLTSVEIY